LIGLAALAVTSAVVRPLSGGATGNASSVAGKPVTPQYVGEAEGRIASEDFVGSSAFSDALTFLLLSLKLLTWMLFLCKLLAFLIQVIVYLHDKMHTYLPQVILNRVVVAWLNLQLTIFTIMAPIAYLSPSKLSNPYYVELTGAMLGGNLVIALPFTAYWLYIVISEWRATQATIGENHDTQTTAEGNDPLHETVIHNAKSSGLSIYECHKRWSRKQVINIMTWVHGASTEEMEERIESVMHRLTKTQLQWLTNNYGVRVAGRDGHPGPNGKMVTKQELEKAIMSGPPGNIFDKCLDQEWEFDPNARPTRGELTTSASMNDTQGNKFAKTLFLMLIGGGVAQNTTGTYDFGYKFMSATVDDEGLSIYFGRWFTQFVNYVWEIQPRLWLSNLFQSLFEFTYYSAWSAMPTILFGVFRVVVVLMVLVTVWRAVRSAFQIMWSTRFPTLSDVRRMMHRYNNFWLYDTWEKGLLTILIYISALAGYLVLIYLVVIAEDLVVKIGFALALPTFHHYVAMPVFRRLDPTFNVPVIITHRGHRAQHYMHNIHLRLDDTFVEVFALVLKEMSYQFGNDNKQTT